MPIKIPVVQTGLEASIQAAAKKAGKSLKINMGSGAKSIEGLSQPLGRITGKADQFTKSMEAANARVLAFGASVGVLSAVTRGFQNLVVTTIEVEKSLASINSILGTSEKQLKDFGKTIFDVAKNTEQSFDTVANAALELSRQGLSAAEVQKRLSDSLILSRLSGLGAAEAVAGLTAAINSFNKEGLSSEQVLNKLSAAAVSAAVSERDLIEGIKRSGSVAVQAGVSFDELVGVITAVQKTTARGGAVIGNSFKTIFTRIQSIDKLETMQDLGVQVTDASGQILGATKLIQNLSKVLGELPDAKKLQIAEGLVGKFQIAPFLAILEDYNKETSTAIEVTKTASSAFNEAYSRNIALNDTLSASINKATVNLKELANTLGEIGVTDSLKNLLGFFNSLVGDIKEVLDGEGVGGDMARGIVKGISSVISGPGLAIFGAIILKLTVDLARFGVGSLKTFFGLNKAAQQQATLQGQIASTLLGNESIQKTILNIENQQISAEQKKVLQTKFFTTALNEQLAIMTKMQSIATRVAPGVMRGTRGGRGRSAGGFIPNYNAVAGYGSESSDISKGVGGAPSSAKPVTIPNFNFGSGQKGTMVANNSEYMVPNFAGGDGSAIFNQDMVSSMGLPAGARKIGAAGGYIPNFARTALGSFRNTYSMNKINPSNRRVFFKTDGTPETDKVKNLLKDHPNSPEAKKLIALRGQIYDANTNPKSVMLIPKKKKFKINEANHRFQKPYKGFNQFLGGIAGIDPKLKKKNSPFKKLLNIKKNLNDALTSAVNTTLNKAIGEGKGSLKANPKTYKTKEVQNIVLKEGGKGAFAAMRGAMFEAIIQAVTGGVAQGSEGTLDVVFDSNREVLEDIFGLKNKNFKFGDFKNSKKSKGTFARQIISNVQKKGVKANVKKKAASGYIPNFAGGLGDAVARESAAGLPINQIRINQDSSLKNSGNPMGLAVTNTRDEPTGAIPNFARRSEKEGFGKDPTSKIRRQGSFGAFDKSTIQAQKEYNKSLKESTKENKNNAKGSRDMLGGIFAVQIGMSALTGATSEMNDGFGRVINRVAGLGASLATAAFAGSAINDFGKSLKGVGGKFVSGLGIYGAALAAGVSVFKGLNTLYEDATGITDANNLAMAKLADGANKAAIKLSDLGELEKLTNSQTRENIMTDLFSLTGNKTLLKTNEKSTPGEGIGFGGQIIFKGGDISNISKIIEEGIAAGISETTILDIFKKRAAGGEQEAEGFFDNLFNVNKFDVLDEKESAAAIDDILKLRSKTEGVDKVFNNLTKEEKSALARRADPKGEKINFDFDKSFTQIFDEFVANQGAIKQVRAKLAEQGVETKNSQNTLLDRASQSILPQVVNEKEEDRLKAKEAELAVDRQMSQVSKDNIKIAVKRASASQDTIDSLNLQLERERLSGNLTKKQTVELEFQRDIAVKDNELKNQSLSTVEAIANKSKTLTLIRSKEEALLTKINAIGEKGFANETDREKLIELTNDLLSENTTEKANEIRLAIELLATESETTEQRKKQLGLIKDATVASIDLNQARAASNIAGQRSREEANFDITQNNKKAQQRRALQKVRREKSDPTILGQEQLRVDNAVADLRDARGNKREALSTLSLTEGKQATELLKGLSDDEKLQLGKKLKFGEGEVTSAENILKKAGGSIQALDAAIEVINDTELSGPLSQLRGTLIENRETVEEQTNSSVILAKANLKNAKTIDVLTLTQEAQNAATNLRRGAAAGALDTASISDPAERLKAQISEASRFARADATDAKDFAELRRILRSDEAKARNIDNEMTIDPASRFKFGISEGNRAARDSALDNKNFKEFRRLTEENEFSFQLVDASVQFAQNIGDAMTKAIAQGEDLGDLLLGVASSFFNTLSQAFMQKAVNNVISGFNAGGKVRGGSGNRDDVPALLTGGEFVMKKSSVNRYGSSFMAALNAGAVPTMQRGGLFTPGTYGQGAMKGKDNLLDFATQGFTTGNFDKTRGGSGFASVNLAPQSAALTMFGRRNSPAFQREQASKEAAFGLFTQQANKEAQLKEQNAMASFKRSASICRFSFVLFWI